MNFELRKKAMNSMSSEKPKMFSRPSPSEDELGDGSDKKPEEMGMISMMVTPEEKKMLEELRDKSGMDELNEDSDESDEFED